MILIKILFIFFCSSLNAANLSALLKANGAESSSYTILYKTLAQTSGSIGAGGRAGTDAFCTTNKPAGLTCTNIHALLSVDSADEMRDIPTNYWFDVNAPILGYNSGVAGDGIVYRFADNWSAMLTGKVHMLIKDVTGTSSVTHWTGTYSIGLQTATCGNWGATGSTSYPGSHIYADSRWLREGTSLSCASTRPLLCVCQK